MKIAYKYAVADVSFKPTRSKWIKEEINTATYLRVTFCTTLAPVT